MPWREATAMSLRLEFVQLATKDGASISRLCRDFGISRKTGYKWLQRLVEGGGTASSLLKGYLSWPCAEQVFCLKRRLRRIRDGKRMKETTYGVTSLTAAEASPERLLHLVRAHWGIENKLHYRRDETLREDRYRLRGQGAQAMAAINSLVLGILRNHSPGYLPDARRYDSAHFEEAVALVTRSPTPG